MASVKKNFLLLMSLQVSTYAVPLLTLPLLTRVLHPDGYGRLSFILAMTNYFIAFTNYGFDLTATPQIALARDDKLARSRIFWATFGAQALITVAGFALLVLMMLLIPRFAADWELLLIGFGMVIGALLAPTWYFQGIENLRVMSPIIFIGRMLSVPAMFLLVRDKSDLYWAAGINSAVPVGSGIAIFAYMAWKREISFVRVPFSDMLKALRDGWEVFIGSTSVWLYASTNTVLLALIAGDVAAGYFAAGDKLVRAAQALLQPLKAAVYPRVSYLMHHDRAEGMSFLRKLLFVQGGIVTIISLTIFFSAPQAVHLLYGAKYQPTVEVLRWMAFVPFAAGMADLFGVQTMLPLGMKTQFSRVLVSSGFLNVALLPLLAHFFAEQGAAAAVMITEAAIALALAYILYAQGITLIGRPATPK
jgi:PST family polysaccharide transporter